jgi:autotransporter-associated beta strand protein
LTQLGTPTTGFVSGSSIGLDVTTGSLTYSNVLANPNGGNNALGLTKLGTGALVLTAANTFSGATRIGSNAGTITLGNNNALQNSTLTNTAQSTIIFANSGTLNVTGTTFNLGGLANSANLVLQDNATPTPHAVSLVVGSNNASTTASGNLTTATAAGSLSNLTKVGTGSLTLSGTANDYKGITTISAGTVLFTNPGALYNQAQLSWTPGNIIVASGATLGLGFGIAGGTTDFNQTMVGTILSNLGVLGSGGLQANSFLGLSVASGASVPYTAAITNTSNGTLGLTKLGTGTLELSGANMYTGDTTISSGVLLLGDVNTAANTTVKVNSANNGLTFKSGQGGTFNLGGLGGGAPSTTIFSVALVDNAPTPNPITISVGGHDASSTFDGILAGAGSLTKVGAGNLTLTQPNTYTGITTVSGTGTLTLAAANGLSTTSGITLSGGTLATGGFAQDFTAGAGGLAPAALTLTTSSKLDLGSASSTTNVFFTDSHSTPWAAPAVLTVSKWTYGIDHLYFDASKSGGLSSTQLNQIKFADFAQGASISSDPANLGELTPRIGNINQDFDSIAQAPIVNVADVSALETALTDVQAYQQTYFSTAADPINDVKFILDVNGDGAGNNLDLQAEIILLANGGGSPAPGGGSVTPVPEPASYVLLGLGSVLLVAHRRRRAVRG